MAMAMATAMGMAMAKAKVMAKAKAIAQAKVTAMVTAMATAKDGDCACCLLAAPTMGRGLGPDVQYGPAGINLTVPCAVVQLGACLLGRGVP